VGPREYTPLAAAALFTLSLAGCDWLYPESPPTDAAWTDGYRVLLVGDIDFGESYRGADRRILQNGYDFGFERVAPFVRTAHLVVGNLETPIVDPVKTPSPLAGRKKYVHWADPIKAPRHLVKQHIHVVSLANNHTLDHGVPGLAQTLDALARHDVRAFGAGVTREDAEKPFETELRVDDRSFRLAIFGGFESVPRYEEEWSFYASESAPGVARLTADRTGELVRAYKANNPASFVVVFPHWGANYAWKSEAQTTIAESVLTAGADAVLGHGAHTLQEIGFHGEGTVIYNLGNFVFNTPGRYAYYDVTPYSLVALLRFTAHNGELAVHARLYPILGDNRVVEYQPRPVRDDELATLAEELATRSGDAFSTRVRTGKDELGSFFEIRLK
jgi:poly-gamma-glutamate capsule biosynthesis protein CapA/YwtB (metallophosphatase superfamily)